MIVFDVRVDATPSRVTVPEALGRVIVRSAVGSTTVSVVSYESAVAPSKSSPPLPMVDDVIILFEIVCASVVPTTSPVIP